MSADDKLPLETGLSMGKSETREYFERRRQQCLELAEAAADPAIAKLHMSFVAHYERAIYDLEVGPNVAG